MMRRREVIALFGGAATFDSELNLLRSSNRTPPRPLGITPPSVPEMGLTLPKFKGGAPEHAHRPLKPEPVVTKQRRPGWVE